MAVRKAVAPALDVAGLVKLFAIVESFDSTKESPTGTTEIAEENGTTPTETFNLLEMLADAELIDSVGRGLNTEWFISVPDVSADNAESVAREALANFTPEPAKPATKVSQPKQTPTPKAAPKNPEKPFKDAEDRAEFIEKAKDEPVIERPKPRQIFKPAPDALPKGTQVTLSDGSTGTIISDEIVTVKVANFDELVKGLRMARDNATNDPTGYQIPEEIVPPTLPKGVSENIWFMAHNAFGKSLRDTLSARLFWMEYASKQFVA